MKETVVIDFPVIKSPNMPPVMASGIENITIKGYIKLSNWLAIIIYTRSTATISTVPSCVNDSFMLSRVPVNS